VLHQLSHSRVPFSLRTLAELADVDEVTAAYLLSEGRALGWLRPTGDGLTSTDADRKTIKTLNGTHQGKLTPITRR
jgi:hypothetical protein